MNSLEDELRALGRSAAVPPVAEGLAAKVLERVEEPPVRRTFAAAVKDKWRALLAALVLLSAGALVAPPVRAAVAEWLNIGGVEAVQVPSGPSSAPAPPTVAGQLTLAEAATVAGFTPTFPTKLGTPTAIEATPGFVAMSWRSQGIRLEQFQAELSPMYLKKYYSELEYLPAVDAYWFSTPHELVLLKPAGGEQVVRVAGPTLVWVRSGVTFRLEGVPDKARAVTLVS
jgi:hypothetical protein